MSCDCGSRLAALEAVVAGHKDLSDSRDRLYQSWNDSNKEAVKMALQAKGEDKGSNQFSLGLMISICLGLAAVAATVIMAAMHK